MLGINTPCIVLAPIEMMVGLAEQPLRGPSPAVVGAGDAEVIGRYNTKAARDCSRAAPGRFIASETSPHHAATMAGLLPDVRGSGAGEARPRNLRLTAMPWQGDVLSPLLIFLLQDRKSTRLNSSS